MTVDPAAFAWDIAAALDIEKIELPLAKIEGLATRLIDLGYSKNPPQIAEVPPVYQAFIPQGQRQAIFNNGPKGPHLMVEFYQAGPPYGPLLDGGSSYEYTNGGELLITLDDPAVMDVMVRVIEL